MTREEKIEALVTYIIDRDGYAINETGAREDFKKLILEGIKLRDEEFSKEFTVYQIKLEGMDFEFEVRARDIDYIVTRRVKKGGDSNEI